MSSTPSAARWKRLILAAAGVLVAVGVHAASAPSQRVALTAEIQLVTAGPGSLTISPVDADHNATCVVDAQQYQGPDTDCVHDYEPGTVVKLHAEPDPGHSLVGWSDFKCARTSQDCTMTLASGTRFVAARFSPVTLKISSGSGAFGQITVTPKPKKSCSFEDGTCEYPWGTRVVMTRQHGAPGLRWVGACEGNVAGNLDPSAAVCALRLESSEFVGAGYSDASGIPPPLGSGITVVLGGSGRGKVTGKMTNGSKTLSCGKRCIISGLHRTDYVRVRAVAFKGSHFYRWDDFNRQKTRNILMESTNRIRATFVKN